MKTTKQILLAVLLLVLANNIHAQWTITPGPGTANGNTLYKVGETIYAGTDFGAYKSTNNGNSWILINNGFTGSYQIKDFYYDGQKLWCAAYGSGLYYSTNYGDEWIGVSGDDIFTVTKVRVSNQYVLSGHSQNNTDPHFTTNNGSNWVIMDQGNHPGAVKAIEINAPFIYAGSNSVGFHISSLGSTSWTRVNGNLSGSSIEINELKYANNKIYIATNAGVWSSTNTGNNWVNLYPSLSSRPFKTLMFLNSNIFIGMDTTLYLSKDNGANWTNIKAGLPLNQNIKAISYNNNYVFVMLNNGFVYRRLLSDLGIVGIQNISSQVPDNFNLSQNYPNPFNPTTNINFTVPKSGFIKMTVYDINGREISTLVNQEMRPGSYKVDFDGSNLSSGIYYYTMISDGFVETKKMMLVK